MRTPTRFLMMTMVAVAACGDGGGGTGPVSQDTAQAGCMTDCQHDLM
jgi:hypothetical protein